MAEGKNKIVVYRDWLSTFESLQDDEAGKLIKHFFRYVNDLNPEAPDRLTSLLFEPIKQTLKRDLKRYEAICLKNSDNISVRWNKKDTTEYDPIRTDTKHTDRDNDSDRDKDSDKKEKGRKRSPFVIPKIEEVEKFFDENGYDPKVGRDKWHYYNDANWFDSKGNPVLSWKQKMRSVWFKPEYKIKQDQPIVTYKTINEHTR